MPRFTPTRLSVRRLLQLVPRGGCLLVFNGSYASWTTQASKTKVLDCFAADPGGSDERSQRVRARARALLYEADGENHLGLLEQRARRARGERNVAVPAGHRCD